MKIIKMNEKNDSHWAEKMVESSSKKYSSLSVKAGMVFCPLENCSVSTINCEICKFCSGVDFDTKTDNEYVRCSNKENGNIKVAKKDEVDRLYISESSNKNIEDINVEDLKSIFARSTSKFDDIDDSELMNASKIVSAKNISENEFDGTSGFNPKFSNSIFDSDNIQKLEESYKNTEKSLEEKTKEAQSKSDEAKREWEMDIKSSLEDIGYDHKRKYMPISHEAEASNPDVSEYKFSVFDNIDDKLKGIPEFTDGEKLKAQAENRKNNISRTKEKDDWESNKNKNTSTSDIVKNFFDDMLGE